ncbi:MAG: hypothetical protein V7786_01875 [Sulfitobacter litoralis]
MTGQFSHWTRPDMARAFDVYGFNLSRIARMTGRTVPDVKSILGGSQ